MTRCFWSLAALAVALMAAATVGPRDAESSGGREVYAISYAESGDTLRWFIGLGKAGFEAEREAARSCELAFVTTGDGRERCNVRSPCSSCVALAVGKTVDFETTAIRNRLTWAFGRGSTREKAMIDAVIKCESRIRIEIQNGMTEFRTARGTCRPRSRADGSPDSFCEGDPAPR